MSSTSFRLPKNPFIDTNVLFEFLLWRFCAETRTRTPVVLRHLSSKGLAEALRWYLDKAKPIHTSPHVIAEIHGLAQSRAGLPGPSLAAFWRIAQHELAQLLLEEHLVQVVKMSAGDLSKFGPTDCSILELAARNGMVVVTEDGALRGRLTQQEIEVLGCGEILALWQKWHM